MNLELELIRG